MTSHAKTYTKGFPFLHRKPCTSHSLSVPKKFPSLQTSKVIRSEKKYIRASGLSHPFRKNLHPCERLESTVQEKFTSVRAAKVIRSELHIRASGLSRPFRKSKCNLFGRLSIRSEKNVRLFKALRPTVIRLNGERCTWNLQSLPLSKHSRNPRNANGFLLFLSLATKRSLNAFFFDLPYLLISRSSLYF